MDARSPLSAPDRGTSELTLVERAKLILQDEIAGGALANVSAAGRVWSAARRDLVVPEMTRRLTAELGALLDTVLDVLAPVPRTPTPSSPLPTTGQDPSPQPGHESGEPVPILCAPRSVPPGGTARIRTAVENDGPAPVEVGFSWSDLLAERGGRIRAACVRLLPDRVRVAPGALADVVVVLDVPHDAAPGRYHALLRATEGAGSRALLVFPVGFYDGEEVSIAR